MGAWPMAELIDKYVSNRPVFLNRYDGHMAIVNSVVFEISRNHCGNQGFCWWSEPHRKAGTQVTGLLRDNAMGS